jgi:hypothetical protein
MGQGVERGFEEQVDKEGKRMKNDTHRTPRLRG